MSDFDVIVVGGGVAGSTTAAALAKKSLRVLVCESGLPSHKRLAGELMHPPAAQRLEELGLLEPLVRAGAAPAYGFAVFRDARDPGTVLSYSEVRGCRPASIAIDHGLLTHTLLAEIAERPGATVWSDARVIAFEPGSDSARVTIRRASRDLFRTAALVVSAEGRESKLRGEAGIRCEKSEPFRMVGWKIRGARLPYPGYGHVFIGGPTPTLAYQVSADEVRIMFELSLAQKTHVPEALIASLPAPFADQVSEAVRVQRPLSTKFVGMLPNRVVGDRLAVVGDAGGCVHPVSASGIAYCTEDAVELASCLHKNALDSAGISDSLRHYEQRRRGPNRTRVALGQALVGAFTGQAPEMRLLRHGLFRYWTQSRRGRCSSMGLLATQNTQMTGMVREYASVIGHALTGIHSGVVAGAEIPQAITGLVKRTVQMAVVR